MEEESELTESHAQLKEVVTCRNIVVGDYTFYHDFNDPKQFQKINAGYFDVPALKEKLYIGKYCSLAHGVMFLSSVTNHPMDGFSTFPFAPVWGSEATQTTYKWPDKGDTRIGNDVWLGMDAVVMPGVTIGHGAIIATRAVVSKDVEPYTIVGGVPAKVIRKRFDDETIAKLLDIAWWDWPKEIVIKNARHIAGNNIEALLALKQEL